MPLNLTPAQNRAVERLRASLSRGAAPLIDHSLIVDSAVDLGAGDAVGAPVIVRPYANGVIVSIEPVAYAPGGDSEADTMHALTPHKYVGAKISLCGQPKTNEVYETLYTLGPKSVCWVVAQNDALSVTFKALATTGIADLAAQIKFGFVDMDELVRWYGDAG